MKKVQQSNLRSCFSVTWHIVQMILKHEGFLSLNLYSHIENVKLFGSMLALVQIKHNNFQIFQDASTDGKDGLPCLNCRLIEMGEMACYQEQCPQCGRVIPMSNFKLLK